MGNAKIDPSSILTIALIWGTVIVVTGAGTYVMIKAFQCLIGI